MDKKGVSLTKKLASRRGSGDWSSLSKDLGAEHREKLGLFFAGFRPQP